MGRDDMCLEVADPATGNASLASVEPPAMPDQMPGPAKDRSTAGWMPTSDAAQSATAQNPTAQNTADQTGAAGLGPEEAAALAVFRRRNSGGEVICIVRPFTDPRSISEFIVLVRASP